MKRLFPTAALAAAIAFAGGGAWLLGPVRQPAAAGTGETALPPGVALGGAFALVDSKGHAVTDRDLRGRWVLLYFGYASCPDVCPTELQTMAEGIDALRPDLAAKVQPVFITVDPERDTPERLADYVALFHPRLIGLTGTPAEVAQAARAYRVYYAKTASADPAEYLMDHSSFLYLVGPDGAVRALFRPGTTSEDLAAALRRRLG